MGAPASHRRQSEGSRIRKLNGEIVRAVLYNGRGVGHGKYLAGSINNVLLLDENDKPIPYRSAGKLELV